MHGRKIVTMGTVATFAILALVGGCREATTGPSSVTAKDFASNLKLLSGNAQTGAVGAALPEPLSVRVVDAGGQPVPGATVLWQVRGGGGVVSPPASTSSVSGLAAVTWTLGTTLGANKVVAILQGTNVLDSATFTATAGVGAANLLTLVSGNTQTGRVASTLAQPLTVNVKDQYGHAVPGVRVSWSSALSSGAVAAVADSTDASGNASANWTLGTSATGQFATATLTGLTPITFSATATPDTSRRLDAVSGNAQSGAAGAELGTSLIVKVTDQYGNIITGENVIFTDSTVGGGTLSVQGAATDAFGLAVTRWTLSRSAGPQSVRARIVGRPERRQFTATSQVQFSSVAAGNYFACALSIDDVPYCWGYGLDAQLGKGATNKSTAAPSAAVAAGDTIAGPFLTLRSLQLGRTYACGVTVAKQMYCWGRVNGNALQALPTAVTFTPPTTVNVVSTGERHHCMTTPSGLAYCTGTNDEGELGNNSITSAADYQPVTGPPNTWSSIAAGSLHTCGVPRYAGVGTVKPWCWGFNSSGQVGNATTATQLKAVAVTLPVGVTGIDSTSLVVGASHSCAIVNGSASATSPDSSVICWGSNGYGQLGDESTFTSTSNSTVAVAVGAVALLGKKFTSLTAGDYHTCGVTSAGETWCWGRNTSGQLGNGSLTSTATPVAVIGGYTWRSVSAGELFTCGVTGAITGGGTTADKGTVICWGDNEYGQLGTGTVSGNNAPVRNPGAAVAYQRP